MKAILATIIATLAVVPAFAAAPSMSVNVTNTPLPVTVTNATTNQSVTVTNSSLPVQVGNTSPIPVTVTPAEPFQVTIQVLNINGSPVAMVTVPAGKQLVIEHVSASLGVVGAGGISNASIYKNLSVAPFIQQDALMCNQTGNDSQLQTFYFACSGQTLFYAGPGERVLFQASAAAGAIPVSATAFISGHYFPAP